MRRKLTTTRILKGLILSLTFVLVSVISYSQAKPALLQHFKKGINLGMWISQYEG